MARPALILAFKNRRSGQMAMRPAVLKQSDLKRYAKAMQETGVRQWRVVARPDGTHEIIVNEDSDENLGPDPDELLK